MAFTSPTIVAPFSTISPNGIQYTSTPAAKAMAQIKTGIWVYYILLIIEGGLRKWVLPGLATPLLIIRDPVALWLCIKAWQAGILKANNYINIIVATTIVAIFTAISIGHGNFVVALYGARIFLLHFPLIFIVGSVFTREDVLKMGRFTVWLSIPMTVLIALQFYSPQSAWVNRGIGGDLEGGGFNGGALGYYRPPGTFSFTNGNVLFYSFLTPFIFYFWFADKQINKLLLIVATGCLLAAVPLSLARALFFQVVITLIFLVAATVFKPSFIVKLLNLIIIGFIAGVVLSQTSFFTTSVEAFLIRFNGANESEGGLSGVFTGRYINQVTGVTTLDLPFFGFGIGTGTSVGAMVMTGGRGMALSEDEWGRLIGEMGYFLGGIIIFVRLFLYGELLYGAYKRLRFNDLLPWLLASFAMPNTPLGQWAQPAGLGFGIMITAVMLASLNVPSKQFT